jgi:hypothetical protein
MIPVIAVIVRGAIGEALGERSLLFRSQYWVGAWRVMLDAWPWGCGPDAFQAAYTLQRPAFAVEEVTSAHAAPVDWLATMGLAGVAMTVAWSLMLWNCGSCREVDAEARDVGQEAAANSIGQRELWMTSLLGLSIVGVIAVVADPDGRVLAAFGIVLAAAFARSIVGALDSLDDRGLRMVLIAPAVVLASHAMVEMTLWQPGSASWVLGAMGVLAMGNCASCKQSAQRSTHVAASHGPDTVPGFGAQASSRRWPIALSVACFVSIASLQGAASWATLHQDRAVEAAAETLVENLFTPPARARSGEQLRTAVEEHSVLRRHLLLLKSADQFLQAGLAEPDPARARVWFDEALDSARAARQAFPFRSVLVSAAIIDAMVERGLAGWEEVIAVRGDLLLYDPRHTTSWVRLIDAYGMTGDQAAARDAARRALDADDSFRLDPLRQLPIAVRERCLAAAGAR